MSFGVYVHIPYCLQRCSYCDFATYEFTEILPPGSYLELIAKEIRLFSHVFPTGPLHSLYFGGGTPSLLPAEDLLRIKNWLAESGHTTTPNTEITLEINPATLDRKKLELLVANGFNRFSVGAQTFHDHHLQKVRRKHTAQQTRETLDLLKAMNVNYSFDLLFALPNQTQAELEADLAEVAKYLPHHVSPYCLTLPEGHPLQINRPEDEQQILMFELIWKHLLRLGYQRYEISNFCLPGYQSRHNSLYWELQPYWGIGLSAHSFLPQDQGWRFWNHRRIDQYANWIQQLPDVGVDFKNAWPKENLEILEPHQAMTDFCHVRLRTSDGLTRSQLSEHFSTEHGQLIVRRLQELEQRDLIQSFDNERWALTDRGLLVSNSVFEALTFLREDLQVRLS